MLCFPLSLDEDTSGKRSWCKSVQGPQRVWLEQGMGQNRIAGTCLPGTHRASNGLSVRSIFRVRFQDDSSCFLFFCHCDGRTVNDCRITVRAVWNPEFNATSPNSGRVRQEQQGRAQNRSTTADAELEDLPAPRRRIARALGTGAGT